MDLKLIKQVVELMERSEIAELEFEEEGLKLRDVAVTTRERDELLARAVFPSTRANQSAVPVCHLLARPSRRALI